MKEFPGTYSKGFGHASLNFKVGSVMQSVAEFLGVQRISPGTFNVELVAEFKTLDDGIYPLILNKADYNGREYVKIKRCKVDGFPSVIIRPEEHFSVEKFKRRIEIMSSVNLREHLKVNHGAEVTIQCQGDENWWND